MKTEELSTKEGIEIILITIVSILLLKYKYFNHHLLSIIFFFVSSIAFDFITKNYYIFYKNISNFSSFWKYNS